MKPSLQPWPISLVARDADVAPAQAPAHSSIGTLTQIYEANFDFVWRNARRLGVPEASADDVTQDVFVVVHRRLADFDGRASMQAWIFGILIRVVRDHQRSFRRKGARNVPLEYTAVAQTRTDSGPTPVEDVERRERVRLLESLLSELDEQKRTLLILSELEGCTLREIAELLDSNVNTIHSRLRAAKRAFEKVYARRRARGGRRP